MDTSIFIQQQTNRFIEKLYAIYESWQKAILYKPVGLSEQGDQRRRSDRLEGSRTFPG